MTILDHFSPAVLTPLNLLPDEPQDGQAYRIPNLSAVVAMRGKQGRLTTVGRAFKDCHHTVLNVRRSLNELEVELQGQWVALSKHVELAVGALHPLRLAAPHIDGDFDVAPLITPTYHEATETGLGWWASNISTLQSQFGRTTIVTCEVIFTRGGETFPANLRVLVNNAEAPYLSYTYLASSRRGRSVLRELKPSLDAQDG